MQKIPVALLMCFAFAVGCLASHAVVAPARAGTDPPRWEYRCIDGWGGVSQTANEFGKAGWEMAAAAGTADSMMWCFKRPLP